MPPNDADIVDNELDIPDAQELEQIMRGDESTETDAQGAESAPFLSWTEGGKEIKATQEEALKWAQMGRGANLKIGEQNKTIAQLRAEIDKYKQPAPQAQQQVVQEQEQDHGSELPEELAPYLSPIMQELHGLKSYVQQLQQEKQQSLASQEDTSLDKEIQSIRDKHADLDWTTPDESGYSLEYRVLEHASKIGTTSFDAAFKSLMHDKLIERAKLSAKDQLVKERQNKRKLGLLDAAPAPSGDDLGYDPARASTSDVFSAALKEYTAS